ncbi:metallophosphoesterase [Micromonospora sp. DR5-3]|uniref:metallophosphoesterase n=1 Tax=unclassified Micromonospora TaxID=2617518 RepID=UPI001CA309C0|nr:MULTISPECIES: metallophosphoesterase [unclassified Micromonospora]MCW3818237.1 metallophosphoesterase [Micromonospora sp. DR5-3]
MRNHMSIAPAGRHRILHLSDTHVTASGVDEDGVDAVAALDRILHDVRFVPGIDLVVVSGDIADDGSVAGCAAVRARVGRFARDRGIPHVYCPGNHDTRESFAAVLGTGHLAADGADVGQPADLGSGQRAAVSVIRGLRVVTLDSLVPGAVHGVVGDEQLRWLRLVLARPAEAGTVVVLHHPPIALPFSPLMGSVNLRDAEQLAAAVAGGDVRAVLCGHYHLQLSGSLAGVPVWVTPGVVTRIDLTAPPRLERAVTGAGASVVDLGGPGSPMFHTLHARDPQAGRQVYLVDAVSGVDVPGE